MQFFILSSSFSSTATPLLEQIDDGSLAPGPTCRSCGEMLSNMRETECVSFKLKGAAEDCLTTGMEFAIREDALAKLRKYVNLGEAVEQRCQVLSKTQTLSDYVLLYPDPEYVRFDKSFTRLETDVVRGCDLCGVSSLNYLDGFDFADETWGGLDLFISGRVFGEVLATDTFKSVCEENNFSGFRFVPTSSFGFDYR
ncbi:MAG: hypothetical protein AAF958_05555 [Planctomycetota bacterium]